MKRSTLSERALVLAPGGRNAAVATAMLREAGFEADACASLPALVEQLDAGAAFVVVTEEALATADLGPLASWIADQQEWSDLPFVLLTAHGGGLERNPAAQRYLELLGNVTFVERPFHPTTLVSLARAALRGRKRQYEARARLEALYEGERRYRALFETIDEGFCVIEFLDGPHGPLSDYVHIEANPAYERHAGISNVVGKTVRAVVPEEAEGWIELYRNVLLSGEPIRFERELMATGRHLDLAAFRVEPASRRQVAVIFQDVSDRKRAEEQLRELNETLEERVEIAITERQAALAQLHEAQKLETLGQLTGGVAHDFNNLLMPIIGALDMLQRRYGADQRATRLVGGALQSAERAKTLVQRLLSFARRQSLETRAVDLAMLVDGMRDLIASSVGSSIEVHIDHPDGLPAALADPNQVELALLNLCVNARDAMPNGGVLTIAVERAALGPSTAPRLKPGLYLRLSVIDTGAGMDAATLARSVEPFFSTKEQGKGTGLGLSTVHGFMGQLGGGMTISSAPGEGTRVDLYFPIADKKDASLRPIESERALVAGRPLSILLVDDEEIVRAGTAEMLRDLGHKVAEARGGAQALALLEGGLQVDAVVSDYKMPHLDGIAFAHLAREARPGLPILIITGYASDDGLRTGLPRLAKPFRQADLAAALNGLFDLDDNIVRLPAKPRS
jgi:PAS domain S-box-containing protein